MRAELLVMFVMGLFYDSKKVPLSDITVITSRQINITTTPLSKYALNIKVQNKGGDATFFIHPISKEERKHLWYIIAFEGNDRKKQLQVLPFEESIGGNSEYFYYKIDFVSALKMDTASEFQIEYVLSDYLKVFPAEINQDRSKYVLWEGTSNYVSVYPIETDQTTVIVGNGKVASYAGTKIGDKIQYGPTKNIPPFSSTKVSIHFENNVQPLTIANDYRLPENWYKPVTVILLIVALAFVYYQFLANLVAKFREPHVST
uniref:Dolichyl-diphosphooligosaccharide--protein glycosyltransferase subunit 1 n=1 Tax=Panagrolaimus sp. PS1159 TaxID=55785 RepID=A0AC35GCG9_9BILA